MRKRLLAIVLLILALTVAGCGKKDTTQYRFSEELTQGDNVVTVKAGLEDEPSASSENVKISVKAGKKKAVTTEFSSDPVQEAWAEDLDDDGNVEVIVLGVESDNEKGVLHVYSFDGKQFSEIPLPDLSWDQEEGYNGHDTYEVTWDKKIVRTYPIYSGSGWDAEPTGATMTLTYTLSWGQWEVEENIEGGDEDASETLAEVDEYEEGDVTSTWDFSF